MKSNRGGAREGAGRPSLYSEPTGQVSFQVPKSKIGEFKERANRILDEWRLAKSFLK